MSLKRKAKVSKVYLLKQKELNFLNSTPNVSEEKTDLVAEEEEEDSEVAVDPQEEEEDLEVVVPPEEEAVSGTDSKIEFQEEEAVSGTDSKIEFPEEEEDSEAELREDLE